MATSFPLWSTAAVQWTNVSSFDSCQLHSLHSHLTVTVLADCARSTVTWQMYSTQ